MFGDYESSHQDASPIELYLFELRGSQETFAYTTSEYPVFWQGIEYMPKPFKRDAIKHTGTLDKSQLNIYTAKSGTLIDLLTHAPPSAVVVLTIYRGHVDDRNNDFRSIWIGRVTNINNKKNESTLSGESDVTSLARPGLTRNYQVPCPYPLYGGLCKAAKVPKAFKIAAGTGGNTVNGAPIGVSDPPDYFLRGTIEWTNASGRPETLWITGVENVGGHYVFTVLGRPVNVTIGQSFTAYFGCLHTRDSCIDRFNNIDNHGGFSWIPDKDPNGTSTPFV